MKQILLPIVNSIYRPIVKWYIARERNYSYHGIKIKVFPGVFHPGFFFSSKLLLQYFSEKDLKGRSVLELGAGSGIISVFCSRKGAVVTASDISKKAISNIQENQKMNDVFFKVIQSDLFEMFEKQQFDVVIINPPYYKKDPVTDADHAWLCGKNSEYFVKLFSTLAPFTTAMSELIMVLADVCDIKQIRGIAKEYGFEFQLLSEHNRLIEKNYLFRIHPT